jgi:hypothetical protein
VAERTGYIGRVRKLARLAAQAYLRQRERLGFPMIADAGARARRVEAAREAAAKREEAGARSNAKASAREDGSSGGGRP